MKITNDQRDVLLAGAIGDAIGYLIEFHDLTRIKKEYGDEGLKLSMIKDDATLTVSDDTQMTLFALEALHRGGGYDEYLAAYKDWFYTQSFGPKNEKGISQYPEMWFQRAPGSTCISALYKHHDGRAERPINDSKGCGGVMRAAPFGFLDSAEDAFNESIIQTEVTHGHGTGFLSSAAFAVLVHTLMRDRGVSNYFSSQALDLLCRRAGSSETVSAILKAQTVAFNTRGDRVKDFKELGQGWIAEEALAIAIYALLVSRSFEECVEIAINHDGDSDSTGSMAAQLWASAYGLPEKYRDWDERLDICSAFRHALDENNYNE